MATFFKADNTKGRSAERIYKQDFLQYFGIKYKDVSSQKEVDFLTAIGTAEVKASYNDDHILYLEEDHNIDAKLGPLKKGWIYTSVADRFIFLSIKTRSMVIVPRLPFLSFYTSIKEDYATYKNDESIGLYGDRWISTYKMIPLAAIKSYYSMFQKC